MKSLVECTFDENGKSEKKATSNGPGPQITMFSFYKPARNAQPVARNAQPIVIDDEPVARNAQPVTSNTQPIVIDDEEPVSDKMSFGFICN